MSQVYGPDKKTNPYTGGPMKEETPYDGGQGRTGMGAAEFPLCVAVTVTLIQPLMQ